MLVRITALLLVLGGMTMILVVVYVFTRLRLLFPGQSDPSRVSAPLIGTLPVSVSGVPGVFPKARP